LTKIVFFFLLLNCSTEKGFLINNYQPKEKRLGETTLLNHKNSLSTYADNIRFILKENLEMMEKCVEDSSEEVSFAFRFTVNPQGKVEDNSVENLADKEQKKCLNKVLSGVLFQQPENSGVLKVYQLITLNRE